MNYLPQYAVMTFLLMATTCFIAFDVLGPVDKKSQDILPGARIVSALAIFVGVWTSQLIGLLSVPTALTLKLELFPLITSLVSGLTLAAVGIMVRTQMGARNAHINTPGKRLLGLVPFVVATVVSGEMLKFGSRLEFSDGDHLLRTASSYLLFIGFIVIAGLFVDKGRHARISTGATLWRLAAALGLALGMVLSQYLYFKPQATPALSPWGHNPSAVAVGDISAAIVGAIMVVVATWLLVKLLQGRLDAKIRETSEELQKASETDSLTGLPNRRCFTSALERAIRENSKGPFAVFFMDLDGFKPINDTYGHAAGDQVLKVVAARLRVAAGKTALAARLGGDEFVILFTGALTKSILEQYAESLIKCVSAPITVGQNELAVTTSVGIAIYPDEADMEKLMSCADAAMYRAKKTGKNGHRFYSPSMADDSPEMMGLQKEMNEGLDRKQFELRLCPQYRVHDGKLLGVETLIFWNHPTRGLLGPDEFLNDAQRLSLAPRMVKWLLQEVAKVQHALADVGCNIRVSVNFGALQVKQHQFIAMVRVAMTEGGLQSRNLCFELREVLVPTPFEAAESCVHTIRAQGLEVSLDDYGRGNVSVRTLKHVGFSRVRIAVEYLEEAATMPGQEQVLHAMVQLLKTLKITAALRGVSTPEQLTIARACGADEMQGPALALPVAVGVIVAAVQPATAATLEGIVVSTQASAT
jgi:diguanylate cyclase (GGDEF)-like protein